MQGLPAIKQLSQGGGRESMQKHNDKVHIARKRTRVDLQRPV